MIENRGAPIMKDIDDRLERLAKETASVAPRRDFADSVMLAVDATNVGWWTDVPRVARRLIPALALVAAFAVAWAVRSTRDVDDALVGSFDGLEIEW